MKLEEFNYHLPGELIAQEPCERRDASRMMVIERKTQSIKKCVFHNLLQYIDAGDVIVVNNSKVIPARLTGRKQTGSAIDILLLTKKGRDNESETWEVLLRPAKRVKTGDAINFHDICEGRIMERTSEKKWIVRFTSALHFDDFLNEYGAAPLPPYIKRRKGHEKSVADRERYQTIYAKIPGSVAAPTAGFHFSTEMIDALGKKGIPIVPITLHVGYGTFLPIETQCVENHHMEEEPFEIGHEAAKIINAAKRVIAVGTTSTRALETAANETGTPSSQIFICPNPHSISLPAPSPARRSSNRHIRRP
jgi:S-adenosylmethionine:tRNA ribosyltransferase-isomerase